MTLRPLSLALALALTAVGASGPAAASDLMDAYRMARDSDPQLGAAESQKLAQGEGVVQSRAALLPQISASASLNDSDRDSTSISTVPNEDGTVGFGLSKSNSDTRSRSYSFDLRQSLYDRTNYTRLHASRARADQSAAEYEAALDGLMTRTAQAYFAVLTAIDSVVLSRAEQRAVGRQLDQAEQRYEVGLTAITDVHEARARHDSARANVIAAENALDDAREALSEITGTWLENIKGLESNFQPMLPEPQKIDDWVTEALDSNPALQARELAVIAANQDIGTARAGHLPTLSASVGYSDNASWGTFTSNGLSFPANSLSDGPTIGISLSVPIFSGFATRSRVRQAVYTRDAVEDQLVQQRRAVTRQTRNAYRALIAGISSIDARTQSVVSAQSALDATEAGFEVGTRTIVDVLQSQQQLYTAQRELSRARHDFLVNTLNLKAAAGTLDVEDIKSVNQHLTVNAEAALAAAETEPLDD